MTKVLICVGPGGVGKTTLAAAAGVRAARKGMKTLVLTIDPARRLAQTMGLGDATDIVKVPGADFPGELWAGVIDHRRTFDDFVRRAADKAPGAERLLNNRLYQQLKSTLAGSQDFTALEKLYSSVRDGGFDLVVLDTPPAQHAIDFLQAPKKLSALFSEGVTRWFRDPSGEKAGFVQKLLNAGTRQVLRVLEVLTGAEFIRELSDFFAQIQGWQGKLNERTAAVHELLISEQTEFALIGVADRGRLQEMDDFVRELNEGAYRLKTVVFNRAVPEWLTTGPEGLPAALRPLYDAHLSHVRRQEQRVVEFSSRLKGEIKVMKLPEWNERIYDLTGLRRVADQLDREFS